MIIPLDILYIQQDHQLINDNNSNNSKISSNNNTFPAVIMIHENKGLNNNIKNMANLLAKEGYVVLAVDLFNGEVTTPIKLGPQNFPNL